MTELIGPRIGTKTFFGFLTQPTRFGSSPSGRTQTKVKTLWDADVVVGGWSKAERSRSSAFGSLLVGACVDHGLSFLGSVGTGFPHRQHVSPVGSSANRHSSDARYRSAGSSSYERLVGEAVEGSPVDPGGEGGVPRADICEQAEGRVVQGLARPRSAGWGDLISGTQHRLAWFAEVTKH